MSKKFNLKSFIIILSFLIISCIFLGFYTSKIKHSFDSDYYPVDLIDSIKSNIHVKDNNSIYIDNSGLDILKKNNIKLQILNNNNEEVFNFNRPTYALSKYTNETLIKTYTNNSETLFIEDLDIYGVPYSCLIYFSPNNIERITFTYNRSQILRAHNFPLFIAVIIILILSIGCIYLINVIKPINKIVDRITLLSIGNYSTVEVRKGLYSDVENSLNLLSSRLHSNELEREKLDKMRKEWISNISHDIKTPLTSIRGNAEIMSVENHYISDLTRIKYCNTIINKADYIKKLVEDLNLSSRLKDHNITLNKKDINIVSLIRHIIIDIVNDDRYSNGNINFTFSQENIILSLDKDLIKRVFINIIINSFVHNNYKVNIDVDITEISKNKARIIIKDDGKGIDKKDIDHIFERYYRGTNTSQEIEGSGLGMAIAHDIVTSHNGIINVESNLNKGTKIIIYL